MEINLNANHFDLIRITQAIPTEKIMITRGEGEGVAEPSLCYSQQTALFGLTKSHNNEK